jgi:hypothetical protein
MQTTNTKITQEQINFSINNNSNSTKDPNHKPDNHLTSLKETEKQKIEEINQKEYLIEHYVEDEGIIKEYKDLFAPIKKRLKYTFYFNVAVCTFSLMYAKNLGFYLSKYFPNMSKSLLNLVLFSSVHAIGFSTILIGGNLAILGVNPKKFLAKYREIDEKIMATDPYKDLTLQGFIEGISEGFNKKPEKPISNNVNSIDAASDKENNKI